MLTAIIPCHSLNELTEKCIRHNIDFLSNFGVGVILVLNGKRVIKRTVDCGQKKIIFSKKSGRSLARNAALDYVNTPFVLFLDADVFLTKFDYNTIKSLVENKNFSFFQGVVNPTINKKTNVNLLKLKINEIYQKDTLSGLRRSGVDSCALIVSLNQIVSCHFNPRYKRSEDTELLLRSQAKAPTNIFVLESLGVDKFVDLNLFSLFKNTTQSIFYDEYARRVYLKKSRLFEGIKIKCSRFFEHLKANRELPWQVILLWAVHTIHACLIAIVTRLLLMIIKPKSKILKMKEITTSNGSYKFCFNLETYELKLKNR